jgi:hypothetical protein
MALDATVAGPSANSYLSVAAADAFALEDIGLAKAAWIAATDEDKEAALIRATEEIDGLIGETSSKADPAQALLFPRLDDVAYGTSTFIIPGRLEKATYLQAAYLIQNAKLIDDAASRRARGLQNFANSDGTGGQLADSPDFGRLHPRVERMLDPLAAGSVIATIIPT